MPVTCAEVEVDIETGGVTLLRYYALHDSGVRINPMMVEGQTRGAIAHGIGNALFEWMGYDETGPADDHDLCRLSPADRDRVAENFDVLSGVAVADTIRWA